jgi:predicted TIM-barrel fold metal-dependent hydrolase
MVQLEFAAFDCDNHYYEARDAFTRHLNPKFAKRGVQWATVGGKERLLAGGRVWRFIPNPTWDPIAQPGALDEYFRGNRQRTSFRETQDADEIANLQIREAFGELDRIANHPEYQDREARCQTLDDQGLSGCLLFPTQGIGLEEALCHDPAALIESVHAFNEWLAEDWGFCYRDRLFGAPMITLVDPVAAVEELEHVASKQARIIVLRCGPVRTPVSSRSPGDPMYDPFWKAVVEAGIAVAFHAGDAGYHRYVTEWGEQSEMEGFRESAFTLVTGAHFAQPIRDTMAAMVCHGVFDRWPELRVASIENGSDWVPGLLASFSKAYAKTPHLFQRDPVEVFRKQVWVSPYYEDDIRLLGDVIGVSQVLMGSDWPHAEGLPEPADYILDLEKCGFDPPAVRAIMRDNGASFLGSSR